MKAWMALATELNTRRVRQSALQSSSAHLAADSFPSSASQDCTAGILDIPARVRSDALFARHLVKLNGMWLNCVDKSLRFDRAVVEIAVENNGLALQYAHLSCRGMRDIIYAAVRQNGRALKFAGDAFKSDHDIILAAVLQDGLALEFAAETLRRKSTIVSEACYQNPDAKRYAIGFADRTQRASQVHSPGNKEGSQTLGVIDLTGDCHPAPCGPAPCDTTPCDGEKRKFNSIDTAIDTAIDIDPCAYYKSKRHRRGGIRANDALNDEARDAELRDDEALDDAMGCGYDPEMREPCGEGTLEENSDAAGEESKYDENNKGGSPNDDGVTCQINAVGDVHTHAVAEAQTSEDDRQHVAEVGEREAEKARQVVAAEKTATKVGHAAMAKAAEDKRLRVVEAAEQKAGEEAKEVTDEQVRRHVAEAADRKAEEARQAVVVHAGHRSIQEERQRSVPVLGVNCLNEACSLDASMTTLYPATCNPRNDSSLMGTSALVAGNKAFSLRHDGGESPHIRAVSCVGGGEYPICIVRQPYEGQNRGNVAGDRIIYM